MTAYAYAQNYYALPVLFTTGASETADYIDKSAQIIRSRLQESNYLGVQAKGLLNQLDEVAGECKVAGWDGYNALPVVQSTIGYAHRFLLALPLGISIPSIGSEPDGCITFEWYQSPIKILSISMSPDGYIHYAYLNGRVKRHGSEPFIGSISREIVQLIDSIVNK